MPAWGKTHTDEQIWNMVAFIKKLPGMTPEQYAALGGKPPAEDEDHMHEGMDNHMSGMDMGESQPHTDAPGTPTDHHDPDAASSASEQIEHRHADGTVESHPAPVVEPKADDDHAHQQ